MPWTPPQRVRVLAIGLAWRDGRLLISEVRSTAGSLQGYRPIGGSIEFGETREEALIREFREELDAPIKVIGPWHALENLYEFEGARGHEIVFAANIELLDAGLAARETIDYVIEDGSRQKAVWLDLATLSEKGPQLYPAGLAELLKRS